MPCAVLPFSRHGVIRAKRVSPSLNLEPGLYILIAGLFAAHPTVGRRRHVQTWCIGFPFQRFPRIEFEQFSCFTSQPSFRRARVIQLVRKQFPDIRRQAGLPPAHFARTGPKSTIQSLNIALAAASRVSFMRRLISILSSSVPRTCAIVRCSRSGAVQFPAARH